MSEDMFLGIFAIVAGLIGLFLPYRWNFLFRPRRWIEWMIPERARPGVARFFAGFTAFSGVIILVGTMFAPAVESGDGFEIWVENLSDDELAVVSVEYPGGATEATPLAAGDYTETMVQASAMGAVSLTYGFPNSEPVKKQIPIQVGPESVGEIYISIHGENDVQAEDAIVRGAAEAR